MKKIITGIIYFLAGVASVELLTVGFNLMNQRSTISFWSGLAIVGVVATFIGVAFYNLVSQPSKTNK